MDINFYLRDAKASGVTAINMFVTVEGQRIKIATGQRILPAHWNIKKQKPLPRFSDLYTDIQAELNKLEKDTIEACSRMLEQGKTVSKETLKKSLFGEKEESLNFFPAFDRYIGESEHTKSKAIIQVYRATKNHLEQFEKDEAYKVSFESMNFDFYNNWLKWFYDNGYLDNTIGKYVKTIKSFLNYATDRGWNKSKLYNKFKVFKHDVDIVYLDEDELNRIQELDLSGKAYLQNARKLFLLACYTGLRFSDLSELKPEHVKSGFIHVTTRKTKEAVKIPLFPASEAIIQQIVSGEAHFITNQKLNVYVKELAKLAGIDEATETVQFRGSTRVSKTVPKYELISTHTGRRTFVTQSLERGMRPEVIMQITGHRDYRSFKKYIKVTDSQKEREMLKAWSKPIMKVS
jgi:site-specific recombinase XerD